MKFKKELNSLILDTDSLSILIDKAAEIIDLINQSDDFDLIKNHLKETENYAILQQAASVSAYLDELSESVIFQFINYVLAFNAKKSTEKKADFHPLLIKLIALHLMDSLSQTNSDFYQFLSQPSGTQANFPFDVTFEPHIDVERKQVCYQFLFNPNDKTWQLLRYVPEKAEGKIINKKSDYIIKRTMGDLLTDMTPEDLNPFIKKSLTKTLQIYENFKQKTQQKKLIKKTFEIQAKNFSQEIENLYQRILKDLPQFEKIDIIHRTYFINVDKKAELMAKLLEVDGLFELKNNFLLVIFLSRSLKEKSQENLSEENLIENALLETHSSENPLLENLLAKDSIKNALLRADLLDLHYITEFPAMAFKKLSKFYFEQASQEQLANLEGYVLYQWVMSLSRDDFVKFRSEGKIKLDYPEYSHTLEELYEAFPQDFSSVLEDMICSGPTINIPNNKEILKYFVDLFFKYDGQWFNLIHYRKGDIYNKKMDLLDLAMKTDPEKTLSIINRLSKEDAKGNKNFPVELKAEEIATLISKSPQQASVLLDYKNILTSLKEDTVSFEPYGEIRHFDHLYKLMRGIPQSYSEKLLRNGLLFAEKGMPHFQYLSGLGAFGGKNPSAFIEPIFSMLHKNLSSSTFMNALSEGLVNNPKVNHLFFKEIFDINLSELAEVLIQFPTIKNLDLGLALNAENQQNIIQFFDKMKIINPELKYHINVELTKEKDQFEFLKNYLSQTDSKIVALTIISDDFRIRSKLLDNDKSSFKQFFDGCIEDICKNNSILQKITINGLSKPIFSFSQEDHKEYRFKKFPLFNTKLISIDTEDFSKPDEKDETTKLLLRNRNIHALNTISHKVRQFQNVLELLPWLSIKGLSAEIIVNIFDRLYYKHTLPNQVSPYISLLTSIEKAKMLKKDNEGYAFSQITNALREGENFLKSTSMNAYYRYKPQKKNIDKLEEFFDIATLQSRVIEAIIDWFLEDRRPDLSKMLSEFDSYSNKSATSLSKLPLVLELNGIANDNSNQASINYCKIKSDLNLYQKAISHSLKGLQIEASVAFQNSGPLDKPLLWKDVACKPFNGFELLTVLKQYSPHNDINLNLNWFKKLSSQIFTNFDDEESALFKKINTALQKYINQKEKPIDEQCDRHKHQHKNQLFELLKPENIKIYKESKPRLYHILEAQRERLANSISKCSVKILLKHSGLFSIHHEQKKSHEIGIITSVEEQINKRIAQLQ